MFCFGNRGAAKHILATKKEGEKKSISVQEYALRIFSPLHFAIKHGHGQLKPLFKFSSKPPDQTPFAKIVIIISLYLSEYFHISLRELRICVIVGRVLFVSVVFE